MTNELGTQLESFEDKAERKKSALKALSTLSFIALGNGADVSVGFARDIIKKYIEEN